MTTIDKIVRIGHTLNTGNVYVHIEFDGARLAITGVEGPFTNGNCKGSCGQILLLDAYDYAPGWDQRSVQQLKDIWERWHLNDMRAGSPTQMEWLRANPVSSTHPKTHYEAATDALDAAGLNPQGARYGSKWWTEEVPAEVIEWLAALPETDRKPAWI